jgi:hypothetical protein
MADDRWPMAEFKQLHHDIKEAARIRRPLLYSKLSIVSSAIGHRSSAIEQRATAIEQRATAIEQRSTDNGQQTADNEIQYICPYVSTRRNRLGKIGKAGSMALYTGE